MPGKCQKCNKPVERVVVEPVESSNADPKTTRSADLVSFICGSCGTVLNVGPDPFWLLRKITVRAGEPRKGKRQAEAEAGAEAEAAS
jgi:uncharacterized protein with PIN domain